MIILTYILYFLPNWLYLRVVFSFCSSHSLYRAHDSFHNLFSRAFVR